MLQTVDNFKTQCYLSIQKGLKLNVYFDVLVVNIESITAKLGSWKIRKTLFTQRSHITKQQESSCLDINLLDFNTTQFYE